MNIEEEDLQSNILLMVSEDVNEHEKQSLYEKNQR